MTCRYNGPSWRSVAPSSPPARSQRWRPPRLRSTPLGTFSYHRIHPAFFSGFDWYRENRSFLIASPEKALIDCLYLSSRKGRRFGRLPAFAPDARFSRRLARAWVDEIPDRRIREHVGEKLSALLASLDSR